MNQFHKIRDLVFKFLADRMPRRVVFSVLVLAALFLASLLLFPLLGGTHDSVLERNEQLKASINQTSRNLGQFKDDHQFAEKNLDKYLALIHSERLVPHTRRVATTELERLAIARGLTSLAYNFEASNKDGAAGALNNPVTGGYVLQVDRIELTLGAPLDTQIYEFAMDLGDYFPGAAVVDRISLTRLPEVSTATLNQVSKGEDSGLVKGEISLTWRTAQAQESEQKNTRAKARRAKGI
jgi:hypothetical protein